MTEFQELAQARIKGDALTRTLLQKVPNPARLQKYLTPMLFTKRKQGQYKIISQTSDTWEVASLRHAVFFGVKPTKIKFNSPREFHRLTNAGKDTLTSDTPIEIFSQYIEFRKCYGNVLVGGLGLGMAAQMLLNKNDVTSVTVIEKDSDIIELIRDQIDPDIKIIQADLFDYLKQPLKYDSAYYDIWYGTGESTWHSEVVPLYRLSRKAGITGPLTAWGETEMHAQFIPSLYAYSVINYAHPWQPYQVFYDAIKKKFGDKPTDKQLKSAIKLYLNGIGTEKWEKMFEWDKVVEAKE